MHAKTDKFIQLALVVAVFGGWEGGIALMGICNKIAGMLAPVLIGTLVLHGIGDLDKQVIREDVRDVQLRAGDMLVFHSIWTDLAQAARSRDFV
ncbi:hypothetical protein, partial [Stenotrophomonas sp. 3diitr2024]|uniref:hypothetical protein n=1 Tax=Stenotrophomonas sp. 3diitr2024 TaxID=3345115 RepID=UPI0035CB8AA8